MSNTPYGYDILDAWGSPPILTLEEFNAYGGSDLVASEAAKEFTLKAVSEAVRSYCGWHIAPSVNCRAICYKANNIFVLPVPQASQITKVDKVKDIPIQGGTVDFNLTLCSYSVEFTSGLDETSGIKQVIYQLATNHLVATAGLREEHAGQVGATYNQTDNGVSGGVRLLASDKELLEPYRKVA